MIDEKKLILHLNDWMLQESYLRQLKNPADTISECIKAVEEQPRIGGWIPCSERLPEADGEYICTQEVCNLSNGKIISKTVELIEFRQGKWMRAKHLKVIAWQPLPEPYKGE